MDSYSHRLLAVFLTAMFVLIVVMQSPALAVVPGSVTAHINNTPGNASFTVVATATGWAKGTINVTVTLLVGPTSTGPWEQLDSVGNVCPNSTSCSAASGGYGVLSGSCTGTGAWYKAVGRASGPGGAAENNPSVVIKHVYGTLPAVVSNAKDVPADCTVIYEGV